jgi:hypothetical protein
MEPFSSTSSSSYTTTTTMTTAFGGDDNRLQPIYGSSSSRCATSLPASSSLSDVHFHELTYQPMDPEGNKVIPPGSRLELTLELQSESDLPFPKRLNLFWSDTSSVLCELYRVVSHDPIQITGHRMKRDEAEAIMIAIYVVYDVPEKQFVGARSLFDISHVARLPVASMGRKK